MLISGFDTPGGLDLRWTGYTTANISTALLGQTLTDGNTCPGALELTVSFTGFGVTSGAIFNYGSGSPQDWTGRTRLHFWVKVVTSDYSALNGVQEIIDSSNYSLHRFGGYLAGSVFADGRWYQSVVDLTPPAQGAANVDFDPTTVNEFQVQLLTPNTSPDGGAGAPATTTVLVDDIWLE